MRVCLNIYPPGFVSEGLLLTGCLLDQRPQPLKVVLSTHPLYLWYQSVLPPLCLFWSSDGNLTPLLALEYYIMPCRFPISYPYFVNSPFIQFSSNYPTDQSVSCWAPKDTLTSLRISGCSKIVQPQLRETKQYLSKL